MSKPTIHDFENLQHENEQLKRKVKELDMLSEIMELQSAFQVERDPRIQEARQFSNKSESVRQKNACVRTYIFDCFISALHDHAQALQMESIELLNWLPWKFWTEKLGNSWDRQEGNIPYSIHHMIEIKKEALDCLIFLVNIFLILDMSAEEIYIMYLEKLGVNENRMNGGY